MKIGHMSYISLKNNLQSKPLMAPPYIERLTFYELKERADLLRNLLNECVVCPRECGARRTEGKRGVCRSTNEVVISSAAPHFGEEPPLVGTHGSGTIFFTSCNLKCQFCQNYEISQLKMGKPISTHRLAEVMLALQQVGCHNINLVTPTHFTPQIIEALVIAIQRGLKMPIVYNCGGYESTQTLKLLENIVSVFMPDIKYSNDAYARKYSGAKDYWESVRAAVKEMYRQVGDLVIDNDGIARRGLLIRHLVLPNQIAGSKAVLEFIAWQISPNSYVNIMDQYRPTFRAYRYPELNRTISSEEYSGAVKYAVHLGLHRGFGTLEN
ncbi:MAG: radical SAM protein [Bacteroidota bacterium]|jgi:putative pyruvate formate lyase activating enzyme